MRPVEEAPQEEKRRERRPPLFAITLVRKAMDTVSFISVEELCNRIYAGVLMNDNKLKFWVDRDLGKNCFLLLAKSIHGINEDGRNWEWIDENENCYEGEVSAPVAGAVQACWPKLSATFKTIMLSPKTTYEVAFVVKKENYSSRLEGGTNLSLTLPDGTRLGRIAHLEKKPERAWIDMLVGTFVTTPKNVGEITINYTCFGGWMYGLIVKGIVFRPKD